MLTVPEQLMHSTVRIECTRKDGSRSTGTGFFFKFLDDGKTHVPVIVTNKHVIRDAHTGSFNLTKRNSDGTAAIGSHLKVEWRLVKPQADLLAEPRSGRRRRRLAEMSKML